MRTLAIVFVLWAFASLPARAQDDGQTLVFAVEHQIFGDVGTVTIDIRRVGIETQVRTSIDIRATVLGLTIRRVTGECREVWWDGQLLHFASVITTNGKAHAVWADFDGSGIVVETPERRAHAPPDTQPEIPWSLRFARASTVMSLAKSGSRRARKRRGSLRWGNVRRRARRSVRRRSRVRGAVRTTQGTFDRCAPTPPRSAP